MRIALVSPYDWLTPGGVNQHIQQLTERFEEYGHEVTIFAPSTGELSDERVVSIGHPLPVPASGSTARIALNPRLGRQVQRALEERQFDVVHVHEPLMPTLPIQVLRASRDVNRHVVNVGTFHATKDGGNRLYSYGRGLLKRWYRELDGKIAVSPPAEQYVGRYFPGYYNVIPNGIDVAHFADPTLERIPRVRRRRAEHPLRRPRGEAEGPRAPAARVQRRQRARPQHAADRGRPGFAAEAPLPRLDGA